MKPTAWPARLSSYVILATTLNCGDGGKSRDAAIGKDGTGIDEDAKGVADLANTRDGFEDGASQACWYQRAYVGTALPRFSFSFVAPDQVTYSCDSGPARDAGPPWPRDLRGVATGVTDTQFTIDTCSAQDACVPNLYTFTLNAPGIRLTIPVGRQVRVQWQLAMFWGCTEWLAVSDDEPGLAGMVWLIGNSGFQTPGSELPFDVGLTQLDCRLPADAYGSSCSGAATGDYAFRFSSKYGPASSLSVGTQESGSFAFQDSAGVEQRMDIHCLRAFQTTLCDDYWAWDYWAVNTSAPWLDAGWIIDGPCSDNPSDLMQILATSLGSTFCARTASSQPEGYISFDGDGRVTSITGDRVPVDKESWVDSLAAYRWPCLAGESIAYGCSL